MSNNVNNILNQNYLNSIVYEVDGQYVKFNMFEEFYFQEEYYEIIAKLEKLRSKYNMIVVDINSPGGYVSSLIHLDNVIRKYEIVVTINSSEACSAGLFLWLAGDYKFAYPYSTFMLHRETWGLYGKTAEQKRYVKHAERLYDLYILPKIKGVFTEEEIALAETTEVWLTGKDLIDRGVCKLADEFDPDGYMIPMTNMCFVGDKTAIISRCGMYEVIKLDKRLGQYNYLTAVNLFKELETSISDDDLDKKVGGTE